MKVNVTTKEKQFEPIELNITIESKRELQFLYSIMCSGSFDLANFANDRTASHIRAFEAKDDTFSQPIFDALDAELTDNNYYS